MRCICRHLYYDSNAYRFDVHTDECLPSFDPDTGEPCLPSEPMAAVSVYKKGTFKSMQECRDPLGSASVHDSLGLLGGHVPPGEPF